MAFNLPKVLQALLLSSSQPLAIKDIQAAFTRFHEQPLLPGVDRAAAAEPAAGDPAAPAPAPAAEEAAEVVVEPAAGDPELYLDVPSLVTATQIREAMDAIAAQLRAAGDGLLLIEGNAGYRLVTEPRFARWVRILRQEPPPVKLTPSALETLAVIAYRQPVTRTEIENIRGVSAEAGLNKLLERDLVYIVGRADTPGRPIQYGTTDDFLEFTGIKSLDELPASDVLSSRQMDEWLRKSENTKAPGDLDMGLPDEQLPLEAPLPTRPAEDPAPASGEPAAESPAPSLPSSA
ncbi:MAG: SMC-Scp complex subunit ScpB [Verrucomicrobia bacterium]|nr:SMC-Scp complex subunit ScpB [Verrucomicrobiota bacterium]